MSSRDTSHRVAPTSGKLITKWNYVPFRHSSFQLVELLSAAIDAMNVQIQFDVTSSIAKQHRFVHAY